MGWGEPPPRTPISNQASSQFLFERPFRGAIAWKSQGRRDQRERWSPQGFHARPASRKNFPGHYCQRTVNRKQCVQARSAKPSTATERATSARRRTRCVKRRSRRPSRPICPIRPTTSPMGASLETLETQGMGTVVRRNAPNGEAPRPLRSFVSSWRWAALA